jgi:hypothetical protein
MDELHTEFGAMSTGRMKKDQSDIYEQCVILGTVIIRR